MESASNDIVGKALAKGDYVVFAKGGKGASGMTVGRVLRVLPKTVEIEVTPGHSRLRAFDQVVKVDRLGAAA
ncbi:hypothetical protein [Pseudomonas sp. SID14000]|uniref:hypothetical protein n=1 Tax=Pseudomonas sp. SID14000 TaxID=1986221 RepID=UPI000B3CF8FA|nr:hypothetical protein [Pseudomonas sp. SID14000]